MQLSDSVAVDAKRILLRYGAPIKVLDDVSDEDITAFNIPTGIPLAYELDDDLKPISREFLGDADAIGYSRAQILAHSQSHSIECHADRLTPP